MAEQKLIMTVEGQVQCCTNPRASDLYFKFEYCHGPGWSIAAGPNTGTSQASKIDANNVCVWNFPINVAFKAERPHGWPQIVFSVFGKNVFGKDVVVGYGAVHIPTSQGRHVLEVPLFAPASSSIMQKLISLISGETPEFLNVNYIAEGESREVVKTESQGEIKLALNVLIGGTDTLDLIL